MDVISALADALEATSVSDFSKLSSAVERTTGANPEDAVSITASVRSLYLFKAMAESPIPDLVAMLITAMQMTSGIVAVAESEKTAFAEKLTRLLGISTLERSIKIEQLKTDYSSLFEDAKLLTDLRPVFDRPGERPVGAIIGHTLKIVIHESGVHKELYVSLDGDDILMLKRITDRAIEKTASLKEFLKSTDIEDLT